MEPNERHHHHQQQPHEHRLPYYHHHHHPTTTSTGNALPSSNNGLFPPPQTNDGSSSLAVYPHSVLSPPMEPLKRKRGRPRKYVTPEQALAAKKMASSGKERREQAAATAGGTSSSNSGSSKIGSLGQRFTPHIINIAPAEDVAQKILLFLQQTKHELCVLSASGSISNASLRHPASTSGGVNNVSYEGHYEILSLSGSYIRAEQGRKTGGLSVSLSGSNGQIIGGAIGTHLTAGGPVQVILGTFQLDRKNGGKGDASNSGIRLTSPASTLGMGFRLGMESSERNPMRGNDEHQHHQTGLDGSHHFMMQAPGMHMIHSQPSEWGGGDNRGGGGVYDLSGRIGQ